MEEWPMTLDSISVDNLCLAMAVAGLALGVLGAVSLRLASPRRA
jgi:hypothetical protein